jgi:DUF971 family protein
MSAWTPIRRGPSRSSCTRSRGEWSSCSRTAVQFELSYELLRVYSPSAEVRGHGPGQEVLQVGKRDVDISSLEPSGSYAVQPTFSDGHSTGIYSWDYLYWLGKNRETLWWEYLERLRQAGASREPGPGPFEQRPKSK